MKVRVKDSGIGIRTQDVSHIFEPFFRADAAKDFSSAGTGLGLAIVKRIVEEHGGAVGVESAMNGGSRSRLPSRSPASTSEMPAAVDGSGT